MLRSTAALPLLNLYDPFGQIVSSHTFGISASSLNNASDNSMGWAADPSRKAETLFTISFVQLGVRTYVPNLGRFLQVDSVEGGVNNSYIYPADPVNDQDYSGKNIVQDFLFKVGEQANIWSKEVDYTMLTITTVSCFRGLIVPTCMAAIALDSVIKGAQVYADTYDPEAGVRYSAKYMAASAAQNILFSALAATTLEPLFSEIVTPDIAGAIAKIAPSNASTAASRVAQTQIRVGGALSGVIISTQLISMNISIPPKPAANTQSNNQSLVSYINNIAGFYLPASKPKSLLSF